MSRSSTTWCRASRSCWPPRRRRCSLAGWCFLGGLWQAATHFPLVLEGGQAQAPWAAVALHSTAGPVIAAVALWLTLRPVGSAAADYP
jgi:hypothetical protein